MIQTQMLWQTAIGGEDVRADEEVVTNRDDLKLLEAVAKGDSGSLEALHRKYAQSLLNYAFSRLGERQLAEEVLQDVLLAIWNGAGRFRGQASVRTWLYTIARKRCATVLRGRPYELAALPEEQLPAADAPDPQDAAADAQTRRAVLAALQMLPPPQREAVELVYLHGFSGPGAAHVLGVPVGTVKSRLHRALKALAPVLREMAP